MYIANRITDPDKQLSCYPDLIFKIKNDDETCEERELIDANAYREFCQALDEKGEDYIYVLFDESGYAIKRMNLSQNNALNSEETWLNRLSEELKCSETIKLSLRALLHYISNKSLDFEESMNALYKKLCEKYEMPCRDRNIGKAAYKWLEKMAVDHKGNAVAIDSFDYEYNKPFSHVYVEKSIIDLTETKSILSEFKDAKVIEIEDCKDVFFRKNQNIMLTHRSRQLILATQHAKMLYPGAPVCQSFGNEHFYYTSCVKNCLFDCEYCYLKGMYPSGHVVVYVDLDKVFEEVKEQLKVHPMYICISYDTDLLALEEKLHYVQRWIDFCIANPDLRIEIRTKSANKRVFDGLKKCDRAIFAFTLSPEEVVSAYEKNTPSLKARLECIKYAIDNGFTVRLCFDPMIYISDWKRVYKEMLDTVSNAIDMNKIYDASVGGFRISTSYLKKMRKVDSHSEIVWFPYENIDGYYQYSKDIQDEMIGAFTDWLSDLIGREKIYL